MSWLPNNAVNACLGFVVNEHLNGALFTLNHLFLENFAVRHAVSYGESGRELNLVAAEDKTEYEKDKPL